MARLTAIASPHLPPLFRPVPQRRDAFVAACRDAADGAQAGTFHWTDRNGLLDAALVLEPDRPLAGVLLARPVAMLALADALVALGPPNARLSIEAPDRILVNGGLVGGVRLAVPDGAAGHDATDQGPPAWAVLGFGIDLQGDPDDDAPGCRPDRTALREEGFGDLTAAELLESLSRHLLSWMDVWESEGDAPVLRAWRRSAGDAADRGEAADSGWCLPDRGPHRMPGRRMQP